MTVRKPFRTLITPQSSEENLLRPTVYDTTHKIGSDELPPAPPSEDALLLGTLTDRLLVGTGTDVLTL